MVEKRPRGIHVFSDYTLQGKHKLTKPIEGLGDLQGIVETSNRPLEFMPGDFQAQVGEQYPWAPGELHDFRHQSARYPVMLYAREVNVESSQPVMLLMNFNFSVSDYFPDFRGKFRGSFLLPDGLKGEVDSQTSYGDVRPKLDVSSEEFHRCSRAVYDSIEFILKTL